ncbi:3'-5' exonuclease [Candidatus Chloroploca sp. Khr17]|uniref:3'-5' exonuclease n=1 Tax=Candidatus Chloroploca sp. Khr17 TaxID=2496869 RepID=UPI00101D31D2|nr:3'-5' exonuclease [Candidatus Chloroploca sp. Khr17]
MCYEFPDRDRAKASAWARETLARTNVVILDTETTGLDDEAEIVQLAMIDLHNADAMSGGVFLDTLIRPSRPIPPAATAIHGITDAMVSNAPTMAEILPLFISLIKHRTVLIYNAEYDLRLLQQSGVPNLAGYAATFVCVMQWYSLYVGDFSEYYGSYRWQRLPGGDHTALGDCRATLAVLKRMAGVE